ncbi:hypothetical protein A2U01_0036166 [Trifolium medium]|uniref:Uncharacterized protein n=1 Tax=Trifolium medium TaxID=97028 RepID=A0A392PSF6_9FABA|nr:hypothetical protein [Trifolium medium]
MTIGEDATSIGDQLVLNTRFKITTSFLISNILSSDSVNDNGNSNKNPSQYSGGENDNGESVT